MLVPSDSYHDGVRRRAIRDSGRLVCVMDRAGGPGERELAHTVWDASPALTLVTYLRAVGDFDEALRAAGEVRYPGRLSIVVSSGALARPCAYEQEASRAARLVNGLCYQAAPIAERMERDGGRAIKIKTEHATLGLFLELQRLSATADMDVSEALAALIAATATSGLDPAALSRLLAPMYDYRPLPAVFPGDPFR